MKYRYLPGLFFLLLGTYSHTHLPDIPDFITHAAQHLSDEGSHLLLQEYIEAADAAHLVALDLFCEKLAAHVEAIHTGRLSAREIITVTALFSWGMILAFFHTLYPSWTKFSRTMWKNANPRLAKYKVFMITFMMWILQNGSFAAVLSAIPAASAELDYHINNIQLEQAHLQGLRYFLKMRILQITSS